MQAQGLEEQEEVGEASPSMRATKLVAKVVAG